MCACGYVVLYSSGSICCCSLTRLFVYLFSSYLSMFYFARLLNCCYVCLELFAHTFFYLYTESEFFSSVLPNCCFSGLLWRVCYLIVVLIDVLALCLFL